MMHFPLPNRRVSAICATALLPLAILYAKDDHGLPNFHKVNGDVYRGGQPSEKGLQRLRKMGVKTIVDLQETDGRARSEARIVQGLGMRYVNIPMRGMQVPSDAQMERALAVITDDAAGPVFVHCQRGADRTGVVLACYRVQHDGWGKKKALSEARKYGMSWYQIQLQYYVLRYDPRHLDADLDRENDADEVTSSSGALN